MSNGDRQAKQQQLEQLRRQVADLEAELKSAPEAGTAEWPPKGYYTGYYATAGFMLGGIAAAASLLFNVVGSLIVGQAPLRLIQVYLTFPLGERAMEMTPADNGITLAIGCCLYLATGMLLGIPFHLVLSRVAADSLIKRVVVATLLALLVWLINFYVLLSWLQPLLFGGRWIVDEIPPWVAALTHVVFGWTMAGLYPLGRFSPYRPETER